MLRGIVFAWGTKLSVVCADLFVSMLVVWILQWTMIPPYLKHASSQIATWYVYYCTISFTAPSTPATSRQIQLVWWMGRLALPSLQSQYSAMSNNGCVAPAILATRDYSSFIGCKSKPHIPLSHSYSLVIIFACLSITKKYTCSFATHKSSFEAMQKPSFNIDLVHQFHSSGWECIALSTDTPLWSNNSLELVPSPFPCECNQCHSSCQEIQLFPHSSFEANYEWNIIQR